MASPPQVPQDTRQKKKRKVVQAIRCWYPLDDENFEESYERSLSEGLNADWEFSRNQLSIEEYITTREEIGAIKVVRPPVATEVIMDTENEEFMRDLPRSRLFTQNKQIAGQTVVLLYPGGEFLPLQLSHEKIKSRREESPTNIRMSQYRVNFATICSDGRYLNKFEMNQVEKLCLDSRWEGGCLYGWNTPQLCN